ncbi:hypothetical protein G3M48_001119 [Beauveria asiatica]|uniref:Calcineurin-like phosphoesterase domain-containing protein n=1 Tax=Beauveria asiatica TaxID=1069075 RepID=A0AAW0S8S5_9HYPO
MVAARASVTVISWLNFDGTGVQQHPPAFGTPERRDGTFQISVFEDLHFGENAWDSWGPQQDINSVKVINSILDQLVVLNGDLITGENAFVKNVSVYVDQIVQPLIDRDLLWASTYGNHDSDFNLSSTPCRCILCLFFRRNSQPPRGHPELFEIRRNIPRTDLYADLPPLS